ncbi:MAG TPA: aspartyl protease family protein [Candidatus Binatia bacterium]|nr:aspartyl protease family protein [Candidatus Binatia bacterium]
MRSIQTVHTRGKVVATGLSGSGASWNEMGGTRQASIFSTPPLGGGTGWDGNESWILDQTGLVIVDDSVMGRSTAINQAYFGNYDLWTPGYGGASVVWGGAKSEKGKHYQLLTVAPPKSKVPFDFWFDATTHLPVKMVQKYGPIVSTMTMGDYRPVHGLMIPYRVDIATSEGNNTSFAATAVNVNSRGGTAHLAKPHSAPHDFSISGGAASTTVPIRLSENHVYIDVMLNGKGPYHFIFDTGGGNILDTDVAKEIDALGGGSLQVSGVGNATEASSFATVKTLQVGGAIVANQVFAVLPMRKGVGMSTGIPTDGVIGYEVLSRFITTFDYGNNTVTFNTPGTYTAPTGASIVPITQNQSVPQFACAIDGVPTTCTLDTGARDSVTFYAPFLQAHPNLIPAKLTATGVSGFGVGGPALGRLGRLRSLTFGGFNLPNLIGDYTTQTEGAFAAPDLGANVGGAVWKRFTMTLDYRALTMTLTPNAAFNNPDQWDRSGMFLLNTGAITIIDVRPHTPAAEAGLIKGDVITAANGSSTLSLRHLRELFLGAPGTVVHLVVKSKNGATRNVDLTLAEYV